MYFCIIIWITPSIVLHILHLAHPLSSQIACTHLFLKAHPHVSTSKFRLFSLVFMLELAKNLKDLKKIWKLKLERVSIHEFSNLYFSSSCFYFYVSLSTLSSSMCFHLRLSCLYVSVRKLKYRNCILKWMLNCRK